MKTIQNNWELYAKIQGREANNDTTDRVLDLMLNRMLAHPEHIQTNYHSAKVESIRTIVADNKRMEDFYFVNYRENTEYNDIINIESLPTEELRNKYINGDTFSFSRTPKLRRQLSFIFKK